MVVTEYYNIHNIIKVQINKEEKGLFWNLNPEYEYFKVAHLDNPDIIVNVMDFKPSLKDTYIVDEKYYVKYDYIFYRNKMYDVEIKGFEMNGPFVVNIKPKPKGIRKLWPVFATQNLFLRPLIEIKAVNRGYLILHAAGVVGEDGRGYIFAGRGGSGKTTLLMYLLRDGFKYVGEERVLLKNKTMYSYPLNVKLVDFWIKNMKDEDSFPAFYRIRALKAITSSQSPTMGIIDAADVNKIFIIIKKSFLKKPQLYIVDTEQLSEKLLYNNKIDLEYGYMPFVTGITQLGFNRIIDTYLYINTQSQMKIYWQKIKNLCYKYFNNINKYILYLPDQIDINMYNNNIKCVIESDGS